MDMMIPYRCPVTQRYWDAGRALDDFNGEVPDITRVREVFNLPDIDGDTGSGFTDAAVESAYDTFVSWAEGKGNGADDGQSSVSPTDSQPVSAPKNCCP